MIDDLPLRSMRRDASSALDSLAGPPACDLACHVFALCDAVERLRPQAEHATFFEAHVVHARRRWFRRGWEVRLVGGERGLGRTFAEALAEALAIDSFHGIADASEARAKQPNV